MTTTSIQSTFLRLRPDSSIEQLPADAAFWPRLMSGQRGDFHHEYLVISAAYSSDWPSWATMILEAQDGQHDQVELQGPGSFALVPRGTWHTAKIQAETSMLFITAGEGTRNRTL